MEDDRARDRYWPQYHFRPGSGFIGDPNGPIFVNGLYHLFYQFNPEGPEPGLRHWGHAISHDLVNWETRPIALSPDSAYDCDGVWSGNIVIEDGVAHAIYTGKVENGTYGVLATSDPSMDRWEKHPTPIMSKPPAESCPPHWDAQVWRNTHNSWYQLTGGCINGHGAAFLSESEDLRHWDQKGPILAGWRSEHAGFWEFPYLLDFGKEYQVLLFGPKPLWIVRYIVGVFDETAGRFVPSSKPEALIDYGGTTFYAANPSMQDDRGVGGSPRRIMWGWLREDANSPVLSAGWSGMLSLPRVVGQSDDGYLTFTPVPELEVLRQDEFGVELELSPDASHSVHGIGGDALEMCVAFRSPTRSARGSLEILVLCSPDEEELTIIGYSGATRQVYIDRSQSSASHHAEPSLITSELSLDQGDVVEMRIFLDRSVVEVFVNKTVCLTTRVYPTREDSLGIRMKSSLSETLGVSLQAWTLRSTQAIDA